MKRIRSVIVIAALVATGLFVGPAASAWDSGSADGTQPVIAGNNLTMCAIRETSMIYCWGQNTQGQLGRGNTDAVLNVAPVAAPDANLALSVAVGDNTVCAIMIDRTVKCWGHAATGKVGNGSLSSPVTTPTAVTGLTNVAAISVGFSDACAVKQDGTLWCWGTPNWAAAVGFPAGAQSTPVKVAGVSNITDVSLGANHVCALRVDKRVLCWGANGYGQLGVDSTLPHDPIVTVPGIADATAVVTGVDNTCAIRADGTAYCWGNNAVGALGARTNILKSVAPMKVYGLSSVTSLGMQGAGGCAVAAGVAKCWGSNDLGRIGDGQFATQYAPARVVVGLASPTSIWTSYWGSCEIADGGRVWCWGEGALGRLGNGSTTTAYDGTGPGNTFGFAADPEKVQLVNSAPGKPTGTSTLAKKIKITWTAPSTSNGTSAPKDYTIQYRIKGSTTWKTFVDPVTTSRTATVTGLTSGKYYQFKVLPKNWAGTGASSAISGYIKSK